jgi:hypothetical protein
MIFKHATRKDFGTRPMNTCVIVTCCSIMTIT